MLRKYGLKILVSEFKKLCDEIKIREEKTFGYNEVEALLLAALDFIKDHLDEKEVFVQFFGDKIFGVDSNDLVYGDYNYLVQVIQFCICMRIILEKINNLNFSARKTQYFVLQLSV